MPEGKSGLLQDCVQRSSNSNYFPAESLAKIWGRIRTLLSSDRGIQGKVSGTFETILQWAEMLSSTFENVEYATKDSRCWTLAYNPSYLLLVNWSILIFKCKDLCEACATLNEALGPEFQSLSKRILRGSGQSWQEWISARRNIIAHGKNTT